MFIFLATIVMLPNLVWLWVGHGTDVWVCGLVIPSILLIVFFAILGNRLWLASLLLAPFAALAPLEAFYIDKYLRPTSAEILATLVATNPREAREYLGAAIWMLLLYVLAGFLLAMLVAWRSWQSRLRWNHRSRVWVVTGAILLPPIFFGTAVFTSSGNTSARATDGIHSLVSLTDSIEPGYPFGLFSRIAQYHQQWQKMRMGAARLDAFRFKAYRVAAIRRRQVYVFVLGESSRRDHWQLFGYGRPTNPQLLKLNNLVTIPDLVTSWPESINAIPLILTRKPITTSSPIWKEASILRAMWEAGFDTYWISNQLAIGKFDSPVSTYAYEAKHVQFLNHASYSDPGSRDEVLLKPLMDALRDSPNDLFVVLHMMGSHTDYDYRYPSSFEHFRPTQTDPGREDSRQERTRNSYDNTILYTDHVLAQIIDTLRGTDAVSALFFESDHGESLPSQTCSLGGHGNGTRYEYQVPALFWYSEAYDKTFPGRVAILRANSDKKVLNGDTFESLIDMAGINFPGHDESRSLFSPQWTYRPRIVNSPWQANIDSAEFSNRCEFVMPPGNKSTR